MRPENYSGVASNIRTLIVTINRSGSIYRHTLDERRARNNQTIISFR